MKLTPIVPALFLLSLLIYEIPAAPAETNQAGTQQPSGTGTGGTSKQGLDGGQGGKPRMMDSSQGGGTNGQQGPPPSAPDFQGGEAMKMDIDGQQPNSSGTSGEKQGGFPAQPSLQSGTGGHPAQGMDKKQQVPAGA